MISFGYHRYIKHRRVNELFILKNGPLSAEFLVKSLVDFYPSYVLLWLAVMGMVAITKHTAQLKSKFVFLLTYFSTNFAIC